jgi:hypothetical protein
VAANSRTFIVGWAAASALLCISAIARASGPSQLTDRQLDGVTAGGVLVFADADAQALAAYRTMATTGTNTIAGTNAGVQPGFQSEGGLASGVAVSYATNGAKQSAPPPTSSTSVTTGGVVDGNFKLTIAGGGTASALGLTIQAGFTSVYGVWVPGL